MKRRWILWLLVIVFVWVVVSQFTEITKLVSTLMLGQWQWVLVAGLLVICYYTVFALLYWSALDTVDVRSRVRALLPLTFASVFVNTVAPSGGVSGSALFVDDAVRRGESAARSAAGTLLVMVADFGSFALILLASLVLLFRYHDLQTYEVIAALILLAGVLGQIGVLLLGLWRPSLLRRLLEWMENAVNRVGGWFKHPDLLPDDWAEKNAEEFTEAALAITAHPQRLNRTLLIGLSAHLIDIASLYALFLAFRQPIGIGPLVAGYAMCVLFWVVAITPNGIGVVEGVMALVYTSLGVPAEVATIIALAFRGLTFWLPLFIGFLLLRRSGTFGERKNAHAGILGVRTASILTGLMGIINILSAVTPSLADRMALLQQVSPLEVRQGGHLTAALAGFALILLASGLWRRKRAAWQLTVTLLLVSIVSHMVKGLDYEEALLAGALGVWLIMLQPHFHARSDRPSLRQGFIALAAAFVFTLVYGITGFYLLDRHFSINFTLGAAFRQTVTMFTQFYNPGLEPLTHFGHYFADSIYIIGGATLGYALLMLIRPVLIRDPATLTERERAESIVQAYGRTSLARFILFDDKAYNFSPGGSVIGYVEKGRAAVTLGDPIGPSEDAPAAIDEFKRLCEANDWLPAFYQVLPDYLDSYHAAGLKSICIGHEGIVHLDTFTLEGGENKGLRSAVNKLTKTGYRAEIHQPPISDNLLQELREVSDEWLTMMHGSEKTFSLGAFTDDYIRASPVITVYTPEGAISAFANILSEYQLNELTVDLMRRRSEVTHGTMEFLFVSLFQWAREQGYDTFNLGLSALSGVGEDLGDPLAERALHYIYEHINQFYNFKGLHAFKEKFHPEWVPRYLIFPGPGSLPTVVSALIRADSGDHFIWNYAEDFWDKMTQSQAKHSQLDRKEA